jgi:hypothetical protein
VQELVETNYEGKVTVVLKQKWETERTLPNNKLGVIIRDKEKRVSVITDVSGSWEINAIKEETEIMLKFEIIVAIKRMWNLKTKV